MKTNFLTDWIKGLMGAAELTIRATMAAPQLAEATIISTTNTLLYWEGVSQALTKHISAFCDASMSFVETEAQRLPIESPRETLNGYAELAALNTRIGLTSLASDLHSAAEFANGLLKEGLKATNDTIFDRGNNLMEVAQRQRAALETAVREYPKAVREIQSHYGFHFNNPGYKLVDETDRFLLYQVLPINDTQPDDNLNPIMVIPPYVLGYHILGLLPHEGKSFLHAFANQGIPSFIRVPKDIHTTPAVQKMSGEEDVLDTAYFTECLYSHYGKPITLSGYCQGGFLALLALLSGKIDGMVNKFLTCVTPIDGSRNGSNKSLKHFTETIPNRFNKLCYATKVLPSGCQVVSGESMALVFKLQDPASQSPIASFHGLVKGFMKSPEINSTAAAVGHWLEYGKTDLPLGIVRLSAESFAKPISPDGTLPLTLFNQTLNLEHLKRIGVRWMVCVAETDNIVERDAALAPLNHIEAEVCVFPKGHAAIATSHSSPKSPFAFNQIFQHNGETYKGPVVFHLEN